MPSKYATGPRKFWTQEELDRLEDMVKTASYEDCAKALDRTFASVQAACKRYAFKGRPKSVRMKEVVHDWPMPKGPDHHAWVEDRSRFARTRTPQWREARLECFRRDGFTCQWPGCGKHKPLHAHHMIPWAVADELGIAHEDQSNLITVCRAHHYAAHSYLNGPLGLH